MQVFSLVYLLLGYFVLLLAVSLYSSRHANNASFFSGNKKSNWLLVAFGMVGTSLSGVTFVSVPGTVGKDGFAYLQVVLGYVIGYAIIAFVLLPLYYRLELVSIYGYLKRRFGNTAHRTGALFFILSRLLGASARLYLVIHILHLFVLDQLHFAFWQTALVGCAMLLAYTYRGGVKTIVLTDTLQTACMLAGLVFSVCILKKSMQLSYPQILTSMQQQGWLNPFHFDIKSPHFFAKQIIGGVFITIAMTGLDQEMMQKNMSVNTLRNAQKNMLSFSALLFFANWVFLFLGGLLSLFAVSKGIHVQYDHLFPYIVINYLPPWATVVFVLALVSALFPSADGALTALTASFSLDLMRLPLRYKQQPLLQERYRKRIHIGFTVLFFLSVLLFKVIDNRSIIKFVLEMASYTYGPLLGLFAFGIFTGWKIKNSWRIAVVCLSAPLLSWVINQALIHWAGRYELGFLLLPLNGLICFVGLYSLRTRRPLAVC